MCQMYAHCYKYPTYDDPHLHSTPIRSTLTYIFPMIPSEPHTFSYRSQSPSSHNEPPIKRLYIRLAIMEPRSTSRPSNSKSRAAKQYPQFKFHYFNSNNIIIFMFAFYSFVVFVVRRKIIDTTHTTFLHTKHIGRLPTRPIIFFVQNNTQLDISLTEEKKSHFNEERVAANLIITSRSFLALFDWQKKILSNKTPRGFPSSIRFYTFYCDVPFVF